MALFSTGLLSLPLEGNCQRGRLFSGTRLSITITDIGGGDIHIGLLWEHGKLVVEGATGVA